MEVKNQVNQVEIFKWNFLIIIPTEITFSSSNILVTVIWFIFLMSSKMNVEVFEREKKIIY